MTYSSYDLLKEFVENQDKARKIAISLDDKDMLDCLEKLLRDKYLDGVIVEDDYVDLSEAKVTDAGLKYFESHKNT